MVSFIECEFVAFVLTASKIILIFIQTHSNIFSTLTNTWKTLCLLPVGDGESPNPRVLRVITEGLWGICFCQYVSNYQFKL